jgi:hypothetical protein
MRARVLGLSITELVTNWRKEIDPVQPYLADEVSLCGRQSSMAVGELGAILKDTQEADKRRMLAAVLLLGRDDSLLQDVLYAQVIVMDVAADREFLQDIAAESFDTLVRRDWLRFCENPFMLRSPGLYVNAIREACGSSVVGWPAAARVILAALPTVKLAVPEGLQRRLEEIANRSSVRSLGG